VASIRTMNELTSNSEKYNFHKLWNTNKLNLN